MNGDVVLTLTPLEARELAMGLEDHLGCLTDDVSAYGRDDERSVWRIGQGTVLAPVHQRLADLVWPEGV